MIGSLMKINNRRGFTLTELIVVVAIIGILVAVVTPSLMEYLGYAKENVDLSNAATISKIVKNEWADSKIDASTPVGTIKAIIMLRLGVVAMPTVKANSSEKFYLNPTTLSVKVTSAPGSGYTVDLQN